MGWRVDEVWLDTDLLWFREEPQRSFGPIALAIPAFVAGALEPALFAPIPTGIEASQRRRLAARTTRRKRLATRTVPAVALAGVAPTGEPPALASARSSTRSGPATSVSAAGSVVSVSRAADGLIRSGIGGAV